MQLREGNSYKDREGTVWNCYQHSVYDEGWSWCRSTKDDGPALFNPDGGYLPFGMGEHDFDLVEDLGKTTPEDEHEMRMNDWYENRGYLAGRTD